MDVTAYTFEQRPDLAEIGVPSEEVWPEYNLHGDVTQPLWGPMCEAFPQFQSVVVEAGTERIVAEIHSGPLRWDGTEEHLPAGIDDALRQVVDGAGGRADTLCAMAAEISPSAQGAGLASTALTIMRETALRHGYRYLIAPVRPSWKERYPLTPIERYVTWTRPDGRSIDPWIRTHQRLGAVVSTPIPESLRITGSVRDWEDWTAMPFPESGPYVFPRGLATVDIDRDADNGLYYEPNVWVIHDLQP